MTFVGPNTNVIVITAFRMVKYGRFFAWLREMKLTGVRSEARKGEWQEIMAHLFHASNSTGNYN